MLRMDVYPVVRSCNVWVDLRFVSILGVIPGYRPALNVEAKWFNEKVDMGYFGVVKISEEMRQ